MLGTAVTWLIGILTSPTGGKLLSWLLNYLWGKASPTIKDQFSQGPLREHIKKILGDYEKVVLDAQAQMNDGTPLTAEEIAEIRRKKIELEERLINGN